MNIGAALTYAVTHWKTSVVGVALLALGVASYLGVPLPAGIALNGHDLIVDGLIGLGFVVAKG